MKRVWLALLLIVASTTQLPARVRADAPLGSGRVWRMGGHLTAPDGHAFDFTIDFFRYSTRNGAAVLPADVTLVDEATQNVTSERRIERESASRDDEKEPATLGVGRWTLRESKTARGPHFAIDVRTHGTTLELEAVSKTPRVAYDFGHGAHVTYPALAMHGSIDDGQHRTGLAGSGWFDTADGDAAAPPPATRFAAFTIALDDGRELLVECTSVARAPVTRALLVRRDGSVDELVPSTYEFEESSVRHSTHVAADYPSQFGMYVIGQTQQLLLEPVVLDQESVPNGRGAWFVPAAFDVFDNTPGSMGARLGSASGLLLGYARTGTRP